MKTTLLKLAAAALTVAAPAHAVPAVSGRPVPELEALDDIMSNFMDDNGITAGVLGVMQDGRIVYLRGFGEDYDGNDLPENALMRIASCSKTITAAVTRKLIRDGEFDLGDNAFNLGQPGGGVLDCVGTHTPFPSLWNPNPMQPSPMTAITINHLLRHQGGWDRDVTPDITYRELEVAADMEIASPPGRVNTIRWILGQPLEFNPGDDSEYSNVGCLVLGKIAEDVTGQPLISYIRRNILTPSMWVPSTEILQGRTFREFQNPREPRYDDPTLVPNVFDNYGPDEVEDPYGGWDHEARVGQGGIVLSAATMLRFADTYCVGAFDANIGERLDIEPLTAEESHNGGLAGTNSEVRQRLDGYRIFAVFNKRGSPNFGGQMTALVGDYLDNNFVPVIDRTADGFWTEPAGGAGTNVGGYHQPFHSFGEMLSKTESGSRIRLKPGTSDWTGKIGKRRRFDAPLGPAKIGI
jgi:CubicO group peptidase (beta-lactamase class C family)